MDQDGDSGSGLTIRASRGIICVQCHRGLLELYNVAVLGQSNSCYIFEQRQPDLLIGNVRGRNMKDGFKVSGLSNWEVGVAMN